MRKAVFVLVCGIVFGAGAMFYMYVHKNNSVAPVINEQANSSKSTDVPSLSFNTPSSDIILNSSTSVEQKYGELITYGIQQQSIGRYELAYTYFVAAASLDGISLVQKNSANFSAYQTAVLLNDDTKITTSRQAISDADFAALNTSTYQEDEAGE